MPRRNITWLMLAVVVSFVCFQKANSGRRNEHARMFEIFNAVLEKVETDYVEDVPSQDLFDHALKGMIGDLDPYSAYISPDDYEELKQDLDQEFGGIGIQVALEDDAVVVMSPLVGTPAYEAGIMAGDRILAIDGSSTEGFQLPDAVERLRGKVGEPVELTVLHPGAKEPEDIQLERAIIEVESVQGDTHNPDGTWNFFLEDAPGIGYIRISSFGEKTHNEVCQALKWLQDRDMQGLIIDLRTNPGGLLKSAVQISDEFVDSGTIVSTRGRGNQVVKQFEAHGPGTHRGFPIAVLVNKYSASASEIVSACLQDHGVATIIGERTWGKGSVQSVIPIEDLTGRPGAMRLTTAYYWRPSERNIHRKPDAKEEDEWGVTPNEGYLVKIPREQFRQLLEQRRRRDVVRPMQTDEEPEPIPDPQLAKAVEYLQSEFGTSTAEQEELPKGAQQTKPPKPAAADDKKS